jgi:hypothetical protein
MAASSSSHDHSEIVGRMSPPVAIITGASQGIGAGLD